MKLKSETNNEHNNTHTESINWGPSASREHESAQEKRWLKRINGVGRGALVAVFATGVWADHEGYFQIGSGPHSIHPEEIGLTYEGQEAVNDLFQIEEDSTAWKIVDALTVPDSESSVPQDGASGIESIQKARDLLQNLMPTSEYSSPGNDAVDLFLENGGIEYHGSDSTPEPVQTEQGE